MDMMQNYKFVVKKARTERLQRSAIVNMQKLLNKDDLEKKEILRQLDSIVPVNYDCMQSTQCPIKNVTFSSGPRQESDIFLGHCVLFSILDSESYGPKSLGDGESSRPIGNLW